MSNSMIPEKKDEILEIIENSELTTREHLAEMLHLAREETAFTIYISLSEITNTEIGSKLSGDRKLRLQAAIRTLLNANWSKLDVAGDVEL